MKTPGLQGFDWERETAAVRESAIRARAKMNARVHSTVTVEAVAHGKQLIFTTTASRLDRLKILIENRFDGVITKIEYKNECKDTGKH